MPGHQGGCRRLAGPADTLTAPFLGARRARRCVALPAMTDIMDAPPAGAPPGEPSIAPPQTLVMPDDSEPAAPKDEESGGGIYGAGEDAWWATLTIKVCGKSLGEREIKALLGGMLVVTAVSIVLAVSGGGGGAVDGDGGAISGAPGRGSRPRLIARQLQCLRCNSLMVLIYIGPHGQCGRSLAVTARLEL